VRGTTCTIGGGKISYRSEGLQVVPARPSSKCTVEIRYNSRKVKRSGLSAAEGLLSIWTEF
jgi:hypothetical protein